MISTGLLDIRYDVKPKEMGFIVNRSVNPLRQELGLDWQVSLLPISMDCEGASCMAVSII